jgi:lipocalin
MTKQTFLIFAAVMTVAVLTHAAEIEQSKLVKLNDTVKRLDEKKLEGKWFEIYATQVIHQTFEKNCACPSLTIRPLSNKSAGGGGRHTLDMSPKNSTMENIVFNVSSLCFNQSANRIVSVNGTLEQVAKAKFPGAFHIEFMRENKTGSSVVEAQKNETKGKDDDKEDDEDDELEVGPDEINFLIMQIAQQKEAILVAGPTVNAAWILAKQPNLSENDVRPLLDFARQKGFSSLTKAQCPNEIRQRLDRMQRA